MAGGKETPRQKLIGMMYLVLTALLALQVSSAILEKFALINGALEQLSEETNSKNNEVLNKIAEAGRTTSKDSIKLAFENAQKIRELTKNTIEQLDLLKKEMLKQGGAVGDKIDEGFIHNHGSVVATMMIDPRAKQGKAYEQTLKEYQTKLEALSLGMKFENLAKPPREIPEFANDENNKNKSFLEFNFENTPPIAAFATVTEMQTQIYEYEAGALAHLANMADAQSLKFETVFPMIIPQSNIVVAGSKYQAEMYIGASNPALNPVMFRDGQSLPIAVNAQNIKYGKVEFTAPAGGYNAQGIADKKFRAKIEVKGQVFEQDIPYKVIAPTVKITSGALSKLYMNCGNEMNVEVPGLGTNFVPGYSAGGDVEIIKSEKLGQITVIPKSKAKVKLAVSNAGAPIDVVSFDVRATPPPQISVQAAGKDLNSKDGVGRTAIASIKLKAVADDDFANTVPKDAEYRVRKGKVYLRKGTSLGQPVEFQSETINLAAFAQSAKPGDALVFELESITRRTFKGENEPVTLSTQLKYLTIPISN